METPTQVKERPIIFTAEEIRATLDNRKTQKRMIIKPKGHDLSSFKNCVFHPLKDGSWEMGLEYMNGAGEYVDTIKCPYGMPGDELWVKEVWDIATAINDPLPSIFYRADSTGIPTIKKEAWDLQRGDGSHKWRSPIYMPRWASRIQLRVTGVRVEPLQDITEEDAKAEGVTLPARTVTMYESIYIDHFATLWNMINEKRGYSWDSNPWVWVIEFERIEV